jgi:serine/threonine protein kinase
LKLIGFSIGKEVGYLQTIGESGLRSNVKYMSPEQLSLEQFGQQPDHRSDLFSLAVIAFEMLAGALPWRGTTPSDVLSNISKGAPRPLTDFKVPAAKNLEPIFRKALAKNPDERYQSGKDFVRALKPVGVAIASQQADQAGQPPGEYQEIVQETMNQRPKRSQGQAHAKLTEGEYTMNAQPTSHKPSRSLVDWLVDTLDLLRHNARNVLIERWEKRNLGRAVTPPAFDDKDLTYDDLRRLLPKYDELKVRLEHYQKPDGTTVVVTEQHIKSLREQMATAQKTVDRFNLELNKPLSTMDKITVENQRDEFQAKIDHTIEELADILAFLYVYY